MLSRTCRVVVAGKEPLRSALTRLFEEDGSFSDVSGYDSGELLLSGYGALLIAVYNGDFREDRIMDERNRQQMILQMIRKEKIVAIVRGIPSG